MLESGNEFTGTLQPNGSIILDEPPRIAPGRVRVTVAPLQAVRLPSEPILDDSIPAPFDLPREGPVRNVTAEWVDYRYPEAIDGGMEA